MRSKDKTNVVAPRTRKRCGWCENDELYMAYHDEEWGVPMRDSRALFALLQLEGMQAGLSWLTILRKRAHMTKVFLKFSPTALAKKGPELLSVWMEDAGVIRNQAKLKSMISNAEAFIGYEKKEGRGAFAELLWSHVNHQPQQNSFKTLLNVPAETQASKAMSKSLKALGFRFVGPTICYAFMQSAGMVNDHIHGCFRRSQCRDLAKSGVKAPLANKVAAKS